MTESEMYVRAPRTPRTDGRPTSTGRDYDGLPVRLKEEWFTQVNIDCSVCYREGVDQYVPNLLHMNIFSAISRNSDTLFENLKLCLNSVQKFLDFEIARIS